MPPPLDVDDVGWGQLLPMPMLGDLVLHVESLIAQEEMRGANTQGDIALVEDMLAPGNTTEDPGPD